LAQRPSLPQQPPPWSALVRRLPVPRSPLTRASPPSSTRRPFPAAYRRWPKRRLDFYPSWPVQPYRWNCPILRESQIAEVGKAPRRNADSPVSAMHPRNCSPERRVLSARMREIGGGGVAF
jgi:hypothetical protein